jgi:hypothetical protein
MLMTWTFAVYRIMDGFSHKIVFLHCKDNNRAKAVGSLFLAAFQELRVVLSRVRADKEGKNEQVKQFMLAAMGPNCGSFNLVHNQELAGCGEMCKKNTTASIARSFKLWRKNVAWAQAQYAHFQVCAAL